MTRAALLLAMAVRLTEAVSRPVRLNDVPPAIRIVFGDDANSPEAFDRFIAQTSMDSERRLREGEWDHLVYFMLQSRRFTELPPIDPAFSARNNPSQPPPEVLKRIDAFVTSSSTDARFLELRKLMGREPREIVTREYLRAMRFLYEKEHVTRRKEGSQRRNDVAELYQTRGLSTDTGIDANFAVHAGLQAIREIRPQARVTRVLVIGPGLDLAPRTQLREDYPPQSPQPFLIADSLLRLKLASMDGLHVHAVDYSTRVIRFFADFASTRNRTLYLAWQPSEQEHRAYFDDLGERLGKAEPRPGGKKVAVSEQVVERISATRLNIVIERLATERFDLVIATNVLLYLNNRELALALLNIQSMLERGGFFLHNESRPEIESVSRSLLMPVIHARMVRLLRTQARELYDTCVLHETR